MALDVRVSRVSLGLYLTRSASRSSAASTAEGGSLHLGSKASASRDLGTATIGGAPAFAAMLNQGKKVKERVIGEPSFTATHLSVDGAFGGREEGSNTA